MFNIEYINLSFVYSPLLFWVGVICIILFVYYSYKKTIPKLNFAKRTFLALLRAISLILILFIIFEPNIAVATKKIKTKKNLIFIDKSKSMVYKDSLLADKKISDLIEKIKGTDKNFVFYSFDTKLKKLQNDFNLNFVGRTTNFQNVFEEIKNHSEETISASIISDGNLTEGISNLTTLNNIDIPIYTIGLGKKETSKDVYIKKVDYNQYIYAGKETIISTTIISNTAHNKTLNVKLKEKEKIIERKNITINSNGFNKIDFSYKPETEGEKKLEVVISDLAEDENKKNNIKPFYIDVLKDKVKVLIVSGSPSADISVLKNILKKDESIKAETFIKVSQNKYLLDKNNFSKIDSSDILILTGFPSVATDIKTLKKIKEEIRNKPFFILLSEGIDYQKLKMLEENLSFKIEGNNFSFEQTKIKISDTTNFIIKNNSGNYISNWKELPPAIKPINNIAAKVGANIIATSVIKNIETNNPLIIARNIGSQKSISFLIKNLWQINLQALNKKNKAIENFILKSINWLKLKNNKDKFKVVPDKKIFLQGEPIELEAKLYNDIYEPIANALIVGEIESSSGKYKIEFVHKEAGTYRGKFQTNDAGNFTLNVLAKSDSKIIGKTKTNFTITKFDIEKTFVGLNQNYLANISEATGGNFYKIDDVGKYLDVIKKSNYNSEQTYITESNHSLWSIKWLPLVITVLLSAEWILRKQKGLL